MGQSSDFLRQLGGLSPQVVAERVVRFLRARYPRATADLVAAETGLPRSTIAKWLERSNAPNAAAIFTLIAVYQVDFISAVLPGCVWLQFAAQAVSRESLRQQLDASDAALDTLSARLRRVR